MALILKFGADLSKNPLIVHEIEHIKSTRELEAKLPNPFYGFIRATVGRIPDSRNPNVNAYAQFLSFDECLAYHAQAKEALLQLREALLRHDSESTVNRLKQDLAAALDYGSVVADRSSQMARLIGGLVKPASTLKFAIGESGVMTASATFAQAGVLALEIEMPLVRSTPTTSEAQNLQYLKEQFALLDQHGSLAFEQFYETGRLFRTMNVSGHALTLKQIDQMSALLKRSIVGADVVAAH